MARDWETLASVRLVRDKNTGEYAVAVYFANHTPPARVGFATIDGAMTVAADLIRDELHTRRTEPALPPVDPRHLVP